MSIARLCQEEGVQQCRRDLSSLIRVMWLRAGQIVAKFSFQDGRRFSANPRSIGQDALALLVTVAAAYGAASWVSDEIVGLSVSGAAERELASGVGSLKKRFREICMAIRTNLGTLSSMRKIIIE
ncbi:hypothetical protein WQE_22496 [Paraburkholderia hospita]|uniref:Uncharacterized protein n=1 Tax=Paraburkholderia hospita TaxID=169430 RepID=A0AAN1JGH1_9BURK|nr:hypothetical protein C2L64_35650 [Paraburkholderia hospita]EIM99191.1 hypothetical protein WQE_22496 [Paraburkholderia hospita]